MKKNEEETPSDVEYNLKAKFFSLDPFISEMNRKFKSNEKEYIMYSEIIKDLNNLQASYGEDQFRINIPELIYGKCTEKKSVLVMENIKMKGYDLFDKHKGLDYAHVKAAVDQIAKFHAVSHVYCKKQNLTEKYPCFKFDENMFRFVIPMLEDSVKNFAELLKAKGKIDIATRLIDNKSYIIERSIPADMHKGEAPTCLAHGDYWNNNIMYKYANEEDQAEVVDCKIIDWGNVVVGKPLYDLQYFIYTSTTLETRKNHLAAILEQYHSTFVEVTSKLDSPVANWTFQDFQREWQRLNHVGLCMSLFIVSATLSKKNSTNQPTEPNFLDHRLLSPVKWVLDGMKSGMAKGMIKVMYTERGTNLVRVAFRKMLKPMREELLSGENEILTERIMDLLCEADKKGFFTNPTSSSAAE